jgi:hypothetical protein
VEWRGDGSPFAPGILCKVSICLSCGGWKVRDGELVRAHGQGVGRLPIPFSWRNWLFTCSHVSSTMESRQMHKVPSSNATSTIQGIRVELVAVRPVPWPRKL